MYGKQLVSGRLSTINTKKEIKMLKKILYHTLFWIGTLGISAVNVLLLNENPIIYTLIVVVVFCYLLYWLLFHPLIKEIRNR
jgi:hypothetical protein